MNTHLEYENALQGVLAMLPKISIDGRWFMRGQLDAIVSNPRFIRRAVVWQTESNVIPFHDGGSIEKTKERYSRG